MYYNTAAMARFEGQVGAAFLSCASCTFGETLFVAIM